MLGPHGEGHLFVYLQFSLVRNGELSGHMNETSFHLSEAYFDQKGLLEALHPVAAESLRRCQLPTKLFGQKMLGTETTAHVDEIRKCKKEYKNDLFTEVPAERVGKIRTHSSEESDTLLMRTRE